MRPADSWKDYELLDATGGNRLERWGETILIRPDPQVVWKTEKQSPLWAKADAIYHRSNQGGGEWEYRRRLPEKWKISCGEGEDKLTLIVSPTGFKHTGVFPEQAVNWAWYARKIRAAGRPVKVLNLFGYTGGATLACAAAGATVCHVDASKGIVAWGKDNAVASGLADRPIRWLVDDCAKFVAREKRRGNTYDGIIMDPPLRSTATPPACPPRSWSICSRPRWCHALAARPAVMRSACPFPPPAALCPAAQRPFGKNKRGKRARPLSFALLSSSPKGGALGKTGKFAVLPRPLTLGEVASRSDDGEGEAAKNK